jgi:hypothetical protein
MTQRSPSVQWLGSAAIMDDRMNLQNLQAFTLNLARFEPQHTGRENR